MEVFLDLDRVNVTFPGEFRWFRSRGKPFVAVHDASFQVNKGQTFGILGPSGSGKTTVLSVIAGLQELSVGSVFIDGKDMQGVPPNKRGLSLLPQTIPLVPSMLVVDNIAFWFEILGEPKHVRHNLAEQIAEIVGVEHLLKKSTDQLSGGERQRVGLAMYVLATKRVALLDEPLTSLDASRQKELYQFLRTLFLDLGLTSVYVTHDQNEAAAIADCIGVMNEGRIIQVAPYVELYQRPKTLFVAEFIGEMNILPAGALGDDSPCPHTIGVRPEHVRVSDSSCSVEGHIARMRGCEHFGSHLILTLEMATTGTSIRARVDASFPLSLIAIECSFSVAEEHVHRFNMRGLRIGA